MRENDLKGYTEGGETARTAVSSSCVLWEIVSHAFSRRVPDAVPATVLRLLRAGNLAPGIAAVSPASQPNARIIPYRLRELQGQQDYVRLVLNPISTPAYQSGGDTLSHR